MNLAELKALVETAEKMAFHENIKPSDYTVYVIQKSGSISDVKSWSPRDFNRGGVALIIR